MLEALAIRVGEVVQAGTLVGALWGEDAPQSALRSLQSHLSRLRGALPGGLISTSDQGYSLMLQRDDVDARRFEQFGIALASRLGCSDSDETAGVSREGVSGVLLYPSGLVSTNWVHMEMVE